MFEQQYKQANDRIHPRKDLLKEMEARWAAEEAQPQAETDKVLRFPVWVRYGAMAAGILLCVGVGMGTVMLLTRGHREQNKSAAAQAPMMMDSRGVEEEAEILLEAADTGEAEEPVAGEMLLEAAAEGSVQEPPPGMGPATDEWQLETAVRRGISERAAVQTSHEGTEPKTEAEAAPTSEETVQNDAPSQTLKAAPEAAEPEPACGVGILLKRDDLMAVFLPASERVHVVRYENKKLTGVFSLTLREADSQVKQCFWMGNELMAVREKDGGTELLRFDVTDWKAPRHLRNLTQSGTFLGAGEVDGRIVILSLYRAGEEEPLPWVDGNRIDYPRVLLDSRRPGDTFTVITVYDPNQDGFAFQKALLAECSGAAFGKDGLLLWTEDADAALFSFTCGTDGVEFAAETTVPGKVAAAAIREDGFELLLQAGMDAGVLALDDSLQEKAYSVAKAGTIRCGMLYEDGAIFLTDDALWVSRASKDRSEFSARFLSLTGDGFRRLSADRLLVISQTGQLQIIALDKDPLEAMGVIKVQGDLSPLLEDPSCLDYDPDTDRLVFPAGQKVFQYRISGGGDLTIQGASVSLYERDEAGLRDVRCLLTEDAALIFYRDGVIVCNQNLVRQSVAKY